MSFLLLVLNISKQMSVESLKLCHNHRLCYSSHFFIYCRSIAHCLCQGCTYFINSLSLLKTPGARRVTWIKFHAWDSHISSTIVQYVVAYVNWRIEICSPLLCVTDDIARQIANKRILIIITYSVLMSTVVMISGVARVLVARGEKSQGLPLQYYEP